MGEVLEIASSREVSRAWEAYRKHALLSFEDRTLLLSRPYMEEWAKLEARFKKLSLMPKAY